MRTARTLALVLAACGVVAAVGEALAQPAGLNPGRDCQTVRACQFGRGGVYRGCLSSYTCRVCRFVAAPCFIDGSRKVCQRLQCRWG